MGKRIMFKLQNARQIQNLGDLNVHFNRIRVTKCLFRVPSPDSLNARNLTVSLRGFDTHSNVTDLNDGALRPYMFSLPIGEGEFVTYLNVTSGDGGTWDYESQKRRSLETQLEFRLYLDNVPYTPAVDQEIFLELDFCNC